MDVFLGIALAFLALYLIVGLYVGRRLKTLNEFYVMGRKAPTMLVAGSLIATNASTVTLVGYAGNAYGGGPLPFIAFYGVTMVSGLWLGFQLGRYLWRMRLWTVPEYFSLRYRGSGIRTTASVIVVVSVIIYLVSVMLGVTVVLDQVLGWSRVTSLVVVLGIIAAFTMVGGMKSVVITDTIMFGVFFLTSLAVAPFILSAAGGWPVALERAAAELPRFTDWRGASPTFDAIWFTVDTCLVAFVLVVASPHMLSRIFVARSERVIARSKILVTVIVPIFVLAAIYVFGVLPLVARNIEPANAYPWVMTHLLPTVLGALAVSGVVAAAMSTASSLLQQAAAAFSRDIWRRVVGGEVSGTRELFVSRAAIVGTSVIVFIGAVFRELSALSIVYAFFLASAAWTAWVPALVGGLLWRRATSAGALWSMIGGLVVALTVGFGRQYGYSPEWLSPNACGLVTAAGLMVIVSLSGTPGVEELEAHDMGRGHQLQTNR